MDALTTRALALAIEVDEPAAVSDALLEIERLRMAKEGLASAAVAGRITANPGMEAAPSRPVTWARIGESAQVSRERDEYFQEVAREERASANHWYKKYVEATRCPAWRDGPYPRPEARR